jgi:hypothetical protein
MHGRPDFISAWAQCNANKITRTDALWSVDDMHAVKVHHPGRISMISPARRRTIGFCMHPRSDLGVIVLCVVPANHWIGRCNSASCIIHSHDHD